VETGLVVATSWLYVVDMAGASRIALTAPVALVRDLLEWIAARPRTYRDTIDAWRTSCPRLPVWEDALESGFVEIVRVDDHGAPLVVLTAAGRAFLDS
jgi:D-3-phosphoglycerate dehydrogenase